jgi:hypothetical protein
VAARDARKITKWGSNTCQCKWVKLTGGGVKVDQQYGMTTVDLNNLGYRDEPFVLANDVAQIFYVKDMSTKPRKRKDKQTNTSHDEPKRHIVLSEKRIIVGMEDKTDMSEDYNKFDEIPPFRVNTDPTILLTKKILHGNGAEGNPNTR